MERGERQHRISETLGLIKVWLGFMLLFMGSSFAWAIENRTVEVPLIVLAVTFGCVFFAAAVFLTVWGYRVLEREEES